MRKRRAGEGDNEANLDFLLTASHTTRLASSVFWPSALSGVCSSGKRGSEIKRIAGDGRLGRVVRRKIMS